MAPTRSFTRQQVAESICAGVSLFIYDSLVISVPQQWSKSHPGGALAIAHFIGRDATDEVDAYHSPQAIAKLRKFAIGSIDLEGRAIWKPLTPPIALGLVQHPDGVKGHWKQEGRIRLAEAGVERDVRAKLLDSGVVIKDGESYIDVLPSTSSGTSTPSDPSLIVLQPHQLEPLSQSVSDVNPEIELQRSNAYRELRKRITDAGLFVAPKWFAGYTSDLLRYLVLGGIAFGLHLRTTSWTGQMASAVFLGLFYHQLTFLAHDAGHTGITGNYLYDRIIGTIVADWIGGLSLGWWCDNHNIHHLVTNHPEHDPDIQHIPFFAITKDFFSGLWSTYYKRVMALDVFARTFIGIQHKLYYIVLSLARFNLYANSYSYLLTKSPRHRLFYFELTGIAFFWTYFLSMLASLPTWKMRIAYLLVSHIVTSPVHVQIVLSHFACSTEDLGPGESFPSRQLRTTMDVVCGENIEFVHGGLHLQVTHHLFPRLPRHNLRKASKLVKEYCAEQGILYREHGWLEGNQYVLSTLRDVANQLTILKQVAEKEAREGHAH